MNTDNAVTNAQTVGAQQPVRRTDADGGQQPDATISTEDKVARGPSSSLKDIGARLKAARAAHQRGVQPGDSLDADAPAGGDPAAGGFDPAAAQAAQSSGPLSGLAASLGTQPNPGAAAAAAAAGRVASQPGPAAPGPGPLSSLRQALGVGPAPASAPRGNGFSAMNPVPGGSAKAAPGPGPGGPGTSPAGPGGGGPGGPGGGGPVPPNNGPNQPAPGPGGPGPGGGPNPPQQPPGPVPPTYGSATPLTEIAQRAKLANDDAQQANQIYMTMAAERQKWFMQLWQIMQDLQTSVFQMMQQVMLRRQQVVETAAQQWDQLISGAGGGS